jgi:hypothetical protein
VETGTSFQCLLINVTSELHIFCIDLLTFAVKPS